MKRELRLHSLRLLVLYPGFWLLISLAGCSGSAETPGGEPRIEVRKARIFLLPDLAAGYLEVQNNGNGSDRLMKVESDISPIVQTHETIADENGVMRMRPHPEGFVVEAGETLVLQPGGKHLMILNPKPAEKQKAWLQLIFERSGKIEVEAELVPQG